MEHVVDTLEKSTKGMVDYQSGPIEDFPLPTGAPIPVKVHGATVFTFNVERHEEMLS